MLEHLAVKNILKGACTPVKFCFGVDINFTDQYFPENRLVSFPNKHMTQLSKFVMHLKKTIKQLCAKVLNTFSHFLPNDKDS